MNKARRSRPRQRRVAMSILLGCSLATPTLAAASSFESAKSIVTIARRADHQIGSGRQDDPLDGTGERFDQVMKAIPPDSEIHLQRGTYLTRGVHLKNNWRIIGEARDNTVVRLFDQTVNSPSGVASVLWNADFEGFYDYVEVRNLTLDCNRENQRPFREGGTGGLNAVIIASRNAQLSRIRAIGTWANPGEGFPFSIVSNGQRDGTSHAQIDDCENIAPAGRVTAIAIFDQSGGFVSGGIRNCTVRDGTTSAAFGAGGWKNFAVSGNTSTNMGGGIVIDTHDYENVKIDNNRFLANRQYGILMNGTGDYRNIHIYGNRVENGIAADACLQIDSAQTVVDVHDNIFVQSSWRAPAMLIGARTSGTFTRNVVHEHRRSDLSRAHDLRVIGNTDDQHNHVTLGAHRQ